MIPEIKEIFEDYHKYRVKQQLLPFTVGAAVLLTLSITGGVFGYLLYQSEQNHRQTKAKMARYKSNLAIYKSYADSMKEVHGQCLEEAERLDDAYRAEARKNSDLVQNLSATRKQLHESKKETHRISKTADSILALYSNQRLAHHQLSQEYNAVCTDYQLSLHKQEETAALFARYKQSHPDNQGLALTPRQLYTVHPYHIAAAFLPIAALPISRHGRAMVYAVVAGFFTFFILLQRKSGHLKSMN
jgi:hypothetical protein